MQKSKINQLSLAVCLALTPISVYAAGLGKLNTQSGLGEPLKAEIEVMATPEEMASLTAVIASEEAFAAQGITRLGIHSAIKVEVAKNSSGKSVLKLRSNEPIKDPYLDMIIQMDWENGRLQREYTILLDPPTYKATEVINNEAVEVTPAVASSTETKSADNTTLSEVKKPSAKKAKKRKKSVANVPKVDMSVEVAADAAETTTKSGDTLTSIAKELQVEGVSLDQMLAGLYKANQDAFIKGNINRLKVGQIIRVPTKESLASVDDRQARQVVKLHSTNWNAYRNAMARAVVTEPTANDSGEKQSSSGKITTAEDKAAAAKAGPQDVVKLTNSDDAKTIDGKIAALQEETVAREKSLKEGQERAAELESQIKDMKKVLDLKNQPMADMQNAAASGATTTEASPTVPVAADEMKAADVSATASGATDASATVAELPVDPSVNAEEVKPVGQTPAAQPTPPAEIPMEEPSLLDSLMGGDNNLPLIGGGLGVALLGAGWLFLRNKRKKNLDSFERGILTSGGLRANTVFGNTTSNTSTSDTSFLTDFAQSVDGGMIDTNDVDPIAEAEVYMAYGRGAQAEEILKDAIAKEPKRYELHLKLLEIYADNKDTASFETIAGELYTTLGADDPVWAKVVAMGAKLEPQNPLYDLSKIASVATVASATVNTDEIIDFSETIDTSGDTPEINTFSDATDNTLDFSLDDDVSVVGNAPVVDNVIDFPSVDDSQNVDFTKLDMGSEVLDIGTNTASEAAEDTIFAKMDEGQSMDFDIGESISADTEVSDAKSEISALADELPVFDLSLPETGQDKPNPLDLTVATVTPVETLDFSMDFEFPSAPAVEAITSEISDKTEIVSDFSFELPEESLPEVKFADTPDVADTPEEVEPKAQAFDLSSINLDLDKPTVQPTTSSLETANTTVEPPDVEIKLDLVAVYMDMDDKVGARELLEEVIKEGGVSQKQRAQKLLDSLA